MKLLTDEEKELKRLAINPPEPRMTELKAFCRRYDNPECPLTDAERALIDAVAFDVAGEKALYIKDAVTNYKKVSDFLKEKGHTVYMERNYFYKRLRGFFSVLDSRKRRYEYRGNVIVDIFVGNEHETALSIQDHINNGWSITFQSMNNEMLATTFHKAEIEEYL